jgi:hypothetical protein
MLTMIYMTLIQNMSFFLLKVNNPSIHHPFWPGLAFRLAPIGHPVWPPSAPISPPSGFATILQWFCNGFAIISGQTGCPMGAMSLAMSFLNAMSFV